MCVYYHFTSTDVSVYLVLVYVLSSVLGFTYFCSALANLVCRTSRCSVVGVLVDVDGSDYCAWVS